MIRRSHSPTSVHSVNKLLNITPIAKMGRIRGKDWLSMIWNMNWEVQKKIILMKWIKLCHLKSKFSKNMYDLYHLDYERHQ